MLWLNQQGHPVQGVELSRQAIEAFDRENGLGGRWRRSAAFEIYEAGSIQIWVGDFFALDNEQIAPLRAIFDRAALIALPPETRRDYAAKLSALSAPGCRQLLISLEYAQSLREGPPFAVFEEEIDALYPEWRLESLQRLEAGGKQPPAHDHAYGLYRPG